MKNLIHIIMLFMLASLTSLLFLQPLQSQTREAGPWWPHPIWGAEDQAGGSNWITPEKILEAVTLVKTGKVYELGWPYSMNMPLGGARTYTMTIPGFPTGHSVGPDLVYNDEFLCAQIGQVGTQFDGPGHIGKRIKMEDGTTKDIYYNGIPAEEMESPYGLRKNGVENVKPYLTRGILIDIAGLKEVETLPNGYKVTLADVKNALNKQGMSETDIRQGDAILFNFGWWRKWPSQEIYNNLPGIVEEVATWIIKKKAAMVGSDAATDEVNAWTVHHDLMLKNGIWNLEFMNFESILEDQVFEFMFIFTPLPLEGATGSPGRPIAIH